MICTVCTAGFLGNGTHVETIKIYMQEVNHQCQSDICHMQSLRASQQRLSNPYNKLDMFKDFLHPRGQGLS